MEHLLHTKALLAPSCVRSRYGVNLFLCVAVYLAVNASWCAARGRWPPRRVLRKQVLTSLAAAPFYALLPWLVEEMALHDARARVLHETHGCWLYQKHSLYCSVTLAKQQLTSRTLQCAVRRIAPPENMSHGPWWVGSHNVRQNVAPHVGPQCVTRCASRCVTRDAQVLAVPRALIVL
jgi:hypothetical protein